MRFLASFQVLVLGIVAVLAKFPEIEDGDSETVAAIKSVYQTWEPQKEVTVDEDTWSHFQKRNEHRKKRQADNSDYCLEGYTGENCEFPICDSLNTEALSHPSGGIQATVQVDSAYYSSCNITMNTVFDSTLSGIFIKITTNPTAFPEITVMNSAGEIISWTERQGAEWQYGEQKPDLYKIIVQAPELACFISIGGKSTLQIDGGFVPVQSSEAVASDREDSPNTFAYSMVPSTFMVHAYGLPRPGQIVSVTMFQQYNTVGRPQMLLKRYGCAYEYFTETFFCRDRSARYFYRVDGIDFSGNRFRRHKSFSCIQQPPTETPPVTPAPKVEFCENDGTLIQNSNNESYCYCKEYYAGNECEKKLCSNGGFSENENTCICEEGFTGDHCQDVVCLDKKEFGFGTNRATLIFIIRANLAMKGVIDKLASEIRQIADVFDMEPGYLQHFGLIVFHNNEFLLAHLFETVDDFESALKNVTLSDSNNCDDSVLTAISTAVSEYALTNRAPIYVLTDAIPNDEDKSETVFHINSFKALPIYIIYLEPPSSEGCTLDKYHTGYQAMDNVAQRTSGQIFVVPRDNADEAVNVLRMHISYTFYRGALIYSSDSVKCSNRQAVIPINVVNRHTIAIVATGKDLELTWRQMNKTTVNTNPYHVYSDVYFWLYHGLDDGVWGVSIKSKAANSEPCNIRIYYTNVLSEDRKQYDIFWGYSNQVTSDAPFVQPVAYESNALVAHINNYNVLDPGKVFAELMFYRETENGTQELVYLSNGIWRDGCSYELYFAPLICHVEDEKLYFTVYVRDEYGFTIQRSGVSYCSVEHPTFAPPSECANGGVALPMIDNTIPCYCTVDWTGDKCEIPVCHNGGTLQVIAGGSRCKCTAGHMGKHCELLHCTEYGDEVKRSPLGVDFAFVIESNKILASGTNDLQNYIGTIVRDINLQHPNWIARYLLVTYDDKDLINSTIRSRDEIDAFISDVKNMCDLNKPETPVYASGSRLWDALEYITAQINDDSFIFVMHGSEPQQNSVSYYSVINEISNRHITLNAFYAFSDKFNENGFVALDSLCETSGGRAYKIHPSSFVSALQMIPSYYMSSLVYVHKFDDCSSQQTVYFPIDSYTQSIQLNIFGYKSTMDVFKPDGSLFNQDSAYDILDDSLNTGWRIREIWRQSCDNGWVPLGNRYCIYKQTEYDSSWDGAANICRRSRAFLVDIIDASMDSWFDENFAGKEIWIGLHRDSANSSEFYWEPLSNGTRIKLNDGDSHWATNEPSSDTSLKCVLRLQDGNWAVKNCNEQHLFACQKHKFDPDFEPSEISDDDFENGKWWVTVKTEQSSESSTDANCLVEVRVQSNIYIYTAYTLNEHSDIPFYKPATNSGENRFMTYIHDDDESTVLSYALIYDFKTMEMLESATYEKRLQCTYPWLSQNWACSNENQLLYVIHIGEDKNGANFQRMSVGQCPEIIKECNHGFASGGICVCDDYWEGRNCDKPTCVNGGSFSGNVCNCLDGFTGEHCEYEQCTNKVERTFSRDGKTLAFVLETTTNNKEAISTFADNLDGLLKNATDLYPNWFSNYLAVFVNDATNIETVIAASSNDLVEKVKGKLTSITTQSQNCMAPLFTGLLAALNFNDFKSDGSLVFIITKSIASDYDKHEEVRQVLSMKKPQINYVVVDDRESVCGKEIDDPEVQKISDYALLSNGNSFFLATAGFMQFLNSYLLVLYKSAIITNPTFRAMDCSNSRWFIQVDSKMTDLYITTYKKARNFIYDPKGSMVTQQLQPLYIYNLTTFVRLNTEEKAGMYKFTVSRGTSCSIQVRGDSSINVWYGFVQPPEGSSGSHMDDAVANPIEKVDNALVLHAEGLKNIGRLTYVELYNPIDKTILVSQLYKRQDCSYEYYSNTFSCPDNEFLIQVNGVDDNGQNFRRELGVAYCVQAQNNNVH